LEAAVQCTECGHENPTGAQFCNGCGTALSARCAACGGSNPAAARFCNQCGGPLGEVESRKPVLSKDEGLKVESPPTTGAPAHWRTGSPAAYTPRHLADKILQSKSALEACPESGRRGERKQVTVLFADVKGS
jgi:adenylate cyclase